MYLLLLFTNSKPSNSKLCQNRYRLKWRAFKWLITDETTRRRGLCPPTGGCQAEKMPGRKDAHRKPLLLHLTV